MASSSVLAKRNDNARLPISKLPSEVLSTIFLDLRESVVYEATYGKDKDLLRQYMRWTSATQVCHLWRSVALGLLQLWSQIHLDPVQSNKWVVEMLRRSRPCRLILHVDLFESEAEVNQRGEKAPMAFGVLETEVKAEVSRWQELRLRRLTKEQLHDFFDGKLLMPELQTLAIACELEVYEDEWEEPFIVGDDIIDAPSLKRLDLAGCIADWDSQLFRNLTRLRLAYLPKGCLPISRLVSLLDRLSDLHFLSLRGSFLDDTDLIETRRLKKDKVKLPVLDTLSISTTMAVMARLLCLIEPPHPTSQLSKLRINTRWDTDEPTNTDIETEEPCTSYGPIIQRLSTLFSSPPHESLPQSRGIRTLRVVKSSLLDITVQGFTEALSHEQLDLPNQRPSFDLAFAWNDWSDGSLDNFDLEDQLLALLKVLPLQDVTVLEMTGDWVMDSDFWINFSAKAPALEDVLFEMHTDGFFHVLLSTPVHHNHFVFPNLRSITLQDSLNPNWDTQTDFEMIRITLDERARRGAPIQRLLLPSKRQEDVQELDISGCDVLYQERHFKVWLSSECKVEEESDSDDDLELSWN